jgi:hypothetical protein
VVASTGGGPLRRTFAAALAAACVGLLGAGPAPEAPVPARKAVKARAMLDVVSGQMVANPVVLIEGDRIQAAGPGLAIPAGFETLAGRLRHEGRRRVSGRARRPAQMNED